MLFYPHGTLTVGVPYGSYVIDEETGSKGLNDLPNVTRLIMR